MRINPINNNSLYRVNKGGSYITINEYCISKTISKFMAKNTDNNLGFRVILKRVKNAYKSN